MTRCELCGSSRISQSLSVCLECLRERPESLEIVRRRREKWRTSIGLPSHLPRGRNAQMPTLR